MKSNATCRKTLLYPETNQLNQYVEDYVDRIKIIFANTRVGALLLKEHAIKEYQLEKAVQIQKKNQGVLGNILIKMGAVDEKKINNVLNVQKALRFHSVCTFILEELRLGQILVNTQTVTRRQLEEALEKQKSTKKLLGEILIEMRATSRNALKKLLDFQKSIKKVVVFSSLALLLGGGATGISHAEINHNHQEYNYQGKPAAVTPYEFKYKRVRDYLKKAYRFKYEAEKKGADHWQLPEETERLGKGDCEDKSIWLYSKLLNEGFDNVRLVIGKQREDNSTFHTWVAWYPQGKVYILDPTNDDEVWDIQKYPQGYYKPYYSFYRDKSWSHF